MNLAGFDPARGAEPVQAEAGALDDGPPAHQPRLQFDRSEAEELGVVRREELSPQPAPPGPLPGSAAAMRVAMKHDFGTELLLAL